ncbi:MAG: hypothetical protein KDA90_22720 [Planctomycetaceae bacterium]|nr:hypothetical protein [Planctomycetaceae bacterium]
MWRLSDLRRPYVSLGLNHRSLVEYDIARWHLACAEGLAGSENLDVDRVLRQIDQWTEIVRQTTEDNFWKYEAYRDFYNHSEPYFRILHLVSTLWTKCDLIYMPQWRNLSPDDKKASAGFLADSRDGFLHGITNGPGGTCGTIPFLVVSIGRRLGYPLYIVKAMSHLFARWSDPFGRWKGVSRGFEPQPYILNIEATNGGLHTPPDSEYFDWPKPLRPELVYAGAYMKPLMPPEEISESLMARSVCLRQNGHLHDAEKTLTWAVELAPHNPLRRAHLEKIRSESSREAYSPFTSNGVAIDA